MEGFRIKAMIRRIKEKMKGAELSDWLSPMLIKEIRQGMRTKVFVGVFLMVQLLMIFTIILSTIGATATDYGSDVKEAGTGFFWGLISLPLVLVMPLRGAQAVRSEITANTLELLYLTRLSSWRIVFGKWFSLFAQTVLLLVSVMPYVVVRYFLGGVNIMDELAVIGWMLLFSAFFSAFTVGFSAFQSAVLRLGVGVICFFGITTLPGLFFGGGGIFSGLSRGMRSSGWEWLGVPLIGLNAILVGFLLLETGAAQIAPPAENHALKKRIAGILLLGFAVLFHQLGGIFNGMTGVNLIALGFICWYGLLEKPVLIRSLFAKNATRLGLIRFLGRQFYPGWPYGLLYTFCMILAVAFLFLDLSEVKHWMVYFGFITSVLWAMGFIYLFFPKAKNPFLIFLFIQILGALLAAMIGALSSVGVKDIGVFLLPVSPAMFFLIISDTLGSSLHEIVILGSLTMGLVSILAMCYRARDTHREVRKMEQEFRDKKIEMAVKLGISG